MPRYRNSRTGQVVERRHPDGRLDALAVWQRLDPPAPEPERVASAPEPEPPPAATVEPEPESVAGPTPSRSASRGVWAGYARRRGVDPDGMSKSALIDAVG